MDDPKIKELQKQVNDLSHQMQHYERRLDALQQELNSVKNRQVATMNVKPGTSKNFRFENFIGFRVINLVGVVVLVIGLSIGVKYAIDRQLISEATRIALAYSAGIILYVLSWRLKKKYAIFSAILFSGAMASLYFTTYAAFVYYGFFSFGFTFLLMLLFTIYTSVEAIRYDRQEIAVLGMVGAYGIPFLISANSDRAVLFFSYIILINAGIVFLSFKKKWRVMTQLTLLTSWTLFISWGFLRYQPKDLQVGVILLFIFYCVFTINALANKLVKHESFLKGDIQQLTINNIAAYLSSLIIFGEGQFGAHVALITCCSFALMLLLALFSYLFFSSEIILQQALAVQVVVLLALFIGFNWSGLSVTLLWVTLAVVLFVFGIYGHRSWPRLAAILLMSVTLGKLVIFDSSKFSTIQKIVAYIIIGALLLVLSFLYQKFRQTLFDNQKEPQLNE
jgi:uncharacterized membrane protein